MIDYSELIDFTIDINNNAWEIANLIINQINEYNRNNTGHNIHAAKVKKIISHINHYLDTEDI